jgi:biopolymer transport protein ExbD
MAEIAEAGGPQKKGKPKKLSTRVDLTPMVDLGFLLLTFFMLATSMIKPQTMEIAMPPKDDTVKKEDLTKVKASKAVTIILGKDNKVFYYEGTRENDIDPTVKPTDFSASGLRKLLVQKNRTVVKQILELKNDLQKKTISKEQFDKKKVEIMGDKNAPVVVIKATEESLYRDLIDVLDEMAICNIAKYAIVDITDYDKDLIKDLNK